MDAGRVDEADAMLCDDPELAHRHVPVDRPWGQEQWLPLHRAAARGDQPMIECLLAHGAQPDGRTRYRTPDHARATALHLAAANGHVDIVRLLLDKGAALEVRDAQHRSPLSVAAQSGHAAVVRLCAERGAQLEITDERGRTPLHLAIGEVTNADEAQAKAERSKDDAPSALPANPNANVAALALIEAGAYVNATCGS